MNPIRHIRRIAAVLAGILTAGAGALLALAAASPAMAMTARVPHYGPPAPVPPAIHTVTRTVVVGGMPSWQIALIAAGAALLAATLAVLADRARASHRKAIAAAA
jgi:hypothetical protein